MIILTNREYPLIRYMIPITGKYISNDAGAIAIIFIPESNCEV